MFDLSPFLCLIPGLPLAASVLTAFLGPRYLRRRSHWPCILATVGSCVLSLLVLIAVRHGNVGLLRTYYSWFQAGDAIVGFALQADGLTAVMLVTITFVGSLIAIYSVGYMNGDEGYPRFFSEIALFIFSMTGLVLADNFLLLYGFWEGVGLCSYLLIGFWFTKPSAAVAARKAFLVTRIGDVGFLLGILLLWYNSNYSVDYQAIFDKENVDHLYDQGILLTACLLLFCGAVGKSAQFPLHVWLPDAMEGPTPVSALIHAATMVTAGVYLVARCTPLFAAEPMAQLVVACIGAFSALLAALIALTQNDLKRVLAYSTISQLGYMFLALGSGSAVVAAIFHLFTHAFFKALLFLAAGSVMHAMGHVIDMRRFGGLRYALRTTHWTFLCGAAALAGVPLLSGFWSKEEILTAVLGTAGGEGPFAAIYGILFLFGLVTAGLTAFYTFRAYFLTFWGELRVPPEAGDHVHESPRVMLVPLVILALGALLVGFFNAEPLIHGFSAIQALVMIASTAFALGGMALAWWFYFLRPGSAGNLVSRIPVFYQMSLNKFYLDELYDFFIVRVIAGFAEISRVFDLYVVDGIVDLIGQLPRFLGLVFRPIQNGLTQFYALAMALGVTVFIVALAWRYGW